MDLQTTDWTPVNGLTNNTLYTSQCYIYNLSTQVPYLTAVTKSLGTSGSSSIYINLFVHFNYVWYFIAVRNDTSYKCKVLHPMTINVLSLQIMYMTIFIWQTRTSRQRSSIKSQLPLPHLTFRARRQHLFPYDARILLSLFNNSHTDVNRERWLK
jgi:hypothetical protein